MRKHEYPCTSCGGDAFIAYVPRMVTRGKRKGEQEPSWGGKILPGERICPSCGKKRGLKFF